jgi:WD40 repeat protein
LINPEIKENQYYIISGHKSRIIRICNIPEYSLNLQFEVITEELFCFNTTPNDLKLVASYSEYLRFFEIAQGRFLGKYKPISSKSFKHICFLPDGQYLFCIDLNNTIYLLKIEKFDSVPQFALREKLNLEEHLKSQFNVDNNKNEIVYENFIFEFCTNDKI